MNRETWLNQIAEKMAPRFEEVGYPLPKFRVTFGFTSYGQKSRANGECWSPNASRDKTYEIIISITEDSPQMAACILCHELIHTAVGFEHGHKGDFVKVAKLMGLKAPFTASVPTDEFNAWCDVLIKEVGPLPHARLVVGMPKFILDDSEARTIEKMLGELGEETASSGGKTLTTKPKKQTTRLIKVDCEECGYTVRMTQKWIDDKGFPWCPEHGAKMGYADGSGDKENDE